MAQGVVKQFGPIGNGYGTAQPPSGTGEIHCQQVVWPLAHKRDDGAPSRGVWSSQDYVQRGWPKYGYAPALSSARQACIRSIYHRALVSRIVPAIAKPSPLVYTRRPAAPLRTR